jgi:tRNA(Ile)-lysidine synthase TilS/MesJ
VTYLDRKKITSIRPLAYVPEADVIGFANKYSLPVVKNKCPADGNTTREDVKNMVKEYRKKFDHFDSKIFGAIQRADINGWGKS